MISTTGNKALFALGKDAKNHEEIYEVIRDINFPCSGTQPLLSEGERGLVTQYLVGLKEFPGGQFTSNQRANFWKDVLHYKGQRLKEYGDSIGDQLIAQQGVKLLQSNANTDVVRKWSRDGAEFLDEEISAGTKVRSRDLSPLSSSLPLTKKQFVLHAVSNMYLDKHQICTHTMDALYQSRVVPVSELESFMKEKEKLKGVSVDITGGAATDSNVLPESVPQLPSTYSGAFVNEGFLNQIKVKEDFKVQAELEQAAKKLEKERKKFQDLTTHEKLKIDIIDTYREHLTNLTDDDGDDDDRDYSFLLYLNGSDIPQLKDVYKALTVDGNNNPFGLSVPSNIKTKVLTIQLVLNKIKEIIAK